MFEQLSDEELQQFIKLDKNRQYWPDVLSLQSPGPTNPERSDLFLIPEKEVAKFSRAWHPHNVHYGISQGVFLKVARKSVIPHNLVLAHSAIAVP